jgi:L-ascorbate metabolism protein UlaG (beta-lactamase superfamily)
MSWMWMRYQYVIGDLGHTLTSTQLEEIDNVDVLLLPVGGVSTINATTAAQVVRQLEPSVVVPMHYRTPASGRELEPVDKFLKEIGVEQTTPQSKLTFTRSTLPTSSQAFLCQYPER